MGEKATDGKVAIALTIHRCGAWRKVDRPVGLTIEHLSGWSSPFTLFRIL
ncbi:hypothetical protein IQ268_12640 [Oculatella sp. LEGE 06141]|nr:hypothetical protein [Oculatella sp. LEGE 06141]MBE9179410.1 hypothetical protein [Oculatella sp. LEGE 06141]